MTHVKRLTKVKRAPALAAASEILDCLRGFISGEYPFIGVPSFVDCVKCSKGGGSCAEDI